MPLPAPLDVLARANTAWGFMRPAQASEMPARRRIRRNLTAAFLLSAVINALLLSLPLYSLQVFSRAIPSSNLDTLIMLTVIVVIALSLTALLDSVRAQILVRAGNLLDVAYRRLLGQQALDRGAAGQGDLSPLGDLAEVRGFFARPVCTALMDLPWTPIYVIGIWLIHPLLAVLMMAGSVAPLGLAILIDNLVRHSEARSRDRAAGAARLLEAIHTRGDTVRALGMQETALCQWDAGHLAATAHAGAVAERMGWLGGATRWIRYLLQVAVTAVAATLVIDHEMSTGGMIATSLLVGRAMAPVDQITGGWSSLKKSWSACRRVWPRLAQIDGQWRRTPDRVGSGRLVARGLSFTVGNDRRSVLRNVSFELAAGEVLCVFGPNRGGKSTLARLLAGARMPHAGDVRLDGVHLAVMRPVDPRRAVGYLPQQAEWLPGTIGQNISRFIPDASLDEIIDAAGAAGVHELIADLPLGYDTDMAELDGWLRGGTERLVALARAAFGSPPLLVLDEPLNSLDMPNTECVKRFIAGARAAGTTIVVLSHLGLLLEQADKVMVLTEGNVAAFGPRDQVIQPMPQRRPAIAAQSEGAHPTLAPHAAKGGLA